MNQTKKVAVITTTIGRDTLEKAILSIQHQSYPCQHYIFVDGKQYWDKVAHLEEKYPNVIFTFLPMNTGGKNNIGNGAIHAILPYLLQEDIFCFLDDDNWHDTDHIKYLATMIEEYKLDYAYSLRRLYDKNYQYLCDDNFNSLGFWQNYSVVEYENDRIKGTFDTNTTPLIDTNSYAITREIAFKLSSQWYSGISNDKKVFAELLRLNARGGFTGQRTTNYKLIPNYDKSQLTEQEVYEIVLAHNKQMESVDYDWKHPALLIDGKILQKPNIATLYPK